MTTTRRVAMIGMMARFRRGVAHAATRTDRVPEDWRQVWRSRSTKTRKMSRYVDEAV